MKSDKIKMVSVSKSTVSKVENPALDPELYGFDFPLFVSMMPIQENYDSKPLFEKLGNNVIRLNSPHFVQIYCLTPQKEKPICSNMKTVNEVIVDGKCKYWYALPSQEVKTVFKQQTTVNDVDLNINGFFDITLPQSGVYYIQSRGPNLVTESFVIDTRVITAITPTGLSVKSIGQQKVKISWNDTLNNETAFHIIVDQYIGDKWTRLPSYIRANANTTELEYPIQPGYYRFSIRSAISTPEDNWSFNRKVSVNPKDPLQKVTFKTDSSITYSAISDYVYILVDGNFKEPVSPSNFGGTSKSDKSIYFVWQDNSKDETVFHLLEEKWINNSWIRQDMIRIPSNRSSYTRSPRSPGKYRYAIRSAYSFPDTNVFKTSSITNWIEFTVI